MKWKRFFQFIRNLTKSDYLLLHEQIYRFVKKEGPVTYWQCFKVDCSATCQTRDGRVIVRMGLHGHAIPKETLKKRRRENRIIIKKLE